MGGQAGGVRIVVWTGRYDGDITSDVARVLIEGRLGGEDDGGDWEGPRDHLVRMHVS